MFIARFGNVRAMSDTNEGPGSWPNFLSVLLSTV